MQDDGNLVLRSATGAPVWASNTANKQPPAPPQASGVTPQAYFSCTQCTEHGFAWCLTRRRCVQDAAWACARTSVRVSQRE